MFCPAPWHGIPKEFVRHDVYYWVKNLPFDKKIYCCFWQNWDNSLTLPPNYDFYIISYHIENVNVEWLHKQRLLVDGKFIVLFPGNQCSYFLSNTVFVPYNDWHQDIEKIITWHGLGPPLKNKIFKFSAVCNRITQSKIWITTKLLEKSLNDTFILHNPFFLQSKNVHDWQSTGNDTLDSLTNIYLEKYKNLHLSDGFDLLTSASQKINSNPWQPQYTETALHFTNGSLHYSLMEEDSNTYIYPGPDIDEKTLKCLVAGTPFIACGQYQIYRVLSNLGLDFNYEFDVSWDDDPGNVSRFEKICNLIDYLSPFSKNDIMEMTRFSTLHNNEFIQKKGFYNRCEKEKEVSVEKIFSHIENI